MPCTPAQMGQAILRNLEAKTGHPLAYWLDVLHDLQAPDAKTAKAGLKAAGLGHFQAQKVYEASRGANPYADPTALVDALYEPAVRPSYDAAAQYCLGLGDDVAVHPCRTYTPVYAGKQFAAIKPGADGALLVGLALPEGTTHPLLATDVSGRGWTDRINGYLTVAAGSALSAEQREIIAVAYRHNHRS